MIFLEDQARLLLVLHAVLGAGTVAVTTHLFVWSLKWSRGAGRGPGVRWFAVVGLALYLAQFALGNLVYPVYKVRVRAELLDLPSAIEGDAEVRRAAAAEIRARAGVHESVGSEEDAAPLSGVARLFDIKEHWAALGLPLLAAAVWLVFRWDPRREPSQQARWLLLSATGGAAAAAWLAAIIGLYVSAVRAI